MLTRLVQSVFIAVTIAASAQVELEAKRPPFLVCELPDESVLLIVIENFDSRKDAADHCRFFWSGKPHGHER